MILSHYEDKSIHHPWTEHELSGLRSHQSKL